MYRPIILALVKRHLDLISSEKLKGFILKNKEETLNRLKAFKQ